MAAQTKWTAQQQSAIDARGENILVSAAAGSGKTAVLTERAVQRMLDRNSPIDADRLMVVTFTRAAASEMKQRMLKKLAERIEADPSDKFARRQRRLLERDVIVTIDSLCLSILLPTQNSFQNLAALFSALLLRCHRCGGLRLWRCGRACQGRSAGAPRCGRLRRCGPEAPGIRSGCLCQGAGRGGQAPDGHLPGHAAPL